MEDNTVDRLVLALSYEQARSEELMENLKAASRLIADMEKGYEQLEREYEGLHAREERMRKALRELKEDRQQLEDKYWMLHAELFPDGEGAK